jgi:Glycosyl hydrolase family 76
MPPVRSQTRVWRFMMETSLEGYQDCYHQMQLVHTIGGNLVLYGERYEGIYCWSTDKLIDHVQMIEYWYYTGDDRYNQMISDGIQFQTGPENNFEPANQTRTEVSVCVFLTRRFA